MTSPYSRSKIMMEEEGYAIGRTEHWNQFAHIRQDLYGIIDMVGVAGAKDSVLGIQVTTGDKVHEHLLKALANAILPLWLQSGGRFEIHGWRTLKQVNEDGKRGKRDKWECRKIELIWDKTKSEMAIKGETND